MTFSAPSSTITLKNWQLLSVEGAEASSFLHGQLTQDVSGLLPHQWRYTGYCNTKGRLYSTALVWRTNPEHILMMVPQNNADFLVKRLSMFVLRAKAKVYSLGTHMAAIGLLGQAASALLSFDTKDHNLPLKPVQPGEFSHITNNGFLLNCSTAHQSRCVIWLPASNSDLTHYYAQHAVTDTAWQESDIVAGIAHVDALTREAFVPQMINFELIGGVNFKKGCYPGQEIVARSQYLGKLKRRLGIGKVAGAAPVLPMSDVHLAEIEQPVGMVVTVAPTPDNLHWLIGFESPLNAQNAGSLHLADGRVITPLPLPYPLMDVTA